MRRREPRISTEIARKGDGFLVESTVRDIERNLSQRLDWQSLERGLGQDGRGRGQWLSQQGQGVGAVPQNDVRLMNVEDLMEYLDLPRDTIYRQRQEGTGPPGYQIGKNLRWKRSEVDAWLEKHKDDWV
jgi:excisionase family DNA binding protein